LRKVLKEFLIKILRHWNSPLLWNKQVCRLFAMKSSPLASGI
jgi:hypothetical protein